MTVSTHAFASIAPAPYTLVSVVKTGDELKAGREAVVGICAHCGSYLINVATFRAADGVEFAVGLDCAKLAGESVAKHSAALKLSIALDGALASFRPIARLVFAGVYMDVHAKHNKTAAAVMKSFVKLGLAVAVKRTGETRYFFTPAGVALLAPACAGLKAIDPATMRPYV